MSISLLFQYAGVGFSLAYAVVTLSKSKRSLPRFAFALVMLTLAIEGLFVSYSLTSESLEVSLYWQRNKLIAQSFLPVFLLMFSLSYARGNALESIRFWSPILAFFLIAALAITFAFDRGFFILRLVESTPQTYSIALGWTGLSAHLLLILGVVASTLGFERTYRSSVGTMRWRIKFMILGMGTLFVARLYTSSQALLHQGVDTTMDSLNAVALVVSCALVLRTLLRSGHFEIELYPSQAVLRNSFTILFVGIYLFVVGVLAKVVTLFGGANAFPIKALGILLALVLLAIALQSDRFRLFLRRFVSRHFRRPLYDYRNLWRRFTDETSSHVNQVGLCGGLTKLISETFNVLSVSIWLKEEDGKALVLTASTLHLESKIDSQLALSVRDVESMAAHFFKRPQPVCLERLSDRWARLLKEANPNKFPNGGERICICLAARGHFLGCIVVSDRVGGTVFTEQEFDVLGSVGSHSAASLLNLQLSKRLLESKELEAFQTMAAFFVHDLKNAASTLNIMVKNLPVHWDNPEFRNDALRGISKTGDKINHLIARLSTVRSELEVELSDQDATDLVKSVIEKWEAPTHITVVSSLRPVPQVPIDAAQLGNVLQNLLINASESIVNGKGEIQVSTTLENRNVVLSVKDNGCGMNPKFLKESLFRPFQTTKQRGLGIGMFQGKMIVEAHHGRIEVESEQGVGSTFRILLPVGS